MKFFLFSTVKTFFSTLEERERLLDNLGLAEELLLSWLKKVFEDAPEDIFDFYSPGNFHKLQSERIYM